jgi:hypothetical protein
MHTILKHGNPASVLSRLPAPLILVIRLPSLAGGPAALRPTGHSVHSTQNGRAAASPHRLAAGNAANRRNVVENRPETAWQCTALR